MQPAGLQSAFRTPLKIEELYKITLCNLALGMFYWRDFLLAGWQGSWMLLGFVRLHVWQ
jgi:hypothetical protein